MVYTENVHAISQLPLPCDTHQNTRAPSPSQTQNDTSPSPKSHRKSPSRKSERLHNNRRRTRPRSNNHQHPPPSPPPHQRRYLRRHNVLLPQVRLGTSKSPRGVTGQLSEIYEYMVIPTMENIGPWVERVQKVLRWEESWILDNPVAAKRRL